jgi:hypothetical protein
MGCASPCPAPQAPATAAHESAPAEPRTSRLLGTEHPYALLSADPEGRYVVLCQARKDTDGDGQIYVGHVRNKRVGDEFRSYFIEQGPGEPIDAFVSRSDSGRYVAMVRAGKLVLYDAGTRQSITLDTGAAPLIAPTAAEQQSLAQFSKDNRLVLYLRRKGTEAHAILHDLTTHQERRIAEVPGKLWRADLIADGSWVLLLSIERDSNQDGSIDLPSFGTNAVADACSGPISYDAWWADGDEPDFWLVPSQGGQPRRAGDLHTAWRDYVLRRTADGALLLETAPGKSTEVVPASCGAKVVHAHRSVLIVVCLGTPEAQEARKQAQRACLYSSIDPTGPDCGGASGLPLYAYSDGKGTPLGIDGDEPREPNELAQGRFLIVSSRARVPMPSPQPGSANLAALRGEDFVYDVEKRTLRPLGPGRHAQALTGRKLLISEPNKLLVEDLLSGESRQLAAEPMKYHPFITGHFAFARPFEIDLETATVVAQHDDHILALAQDGRLLIEASTGDEPEPEPSPAADDIERLRKGYASYRAAPIGPLRWLAPQR